MTVEVFRQEDGYSVVLVTKVPALHRNGSLAPVWEVVGKRIDPKTGEVEPVVQKREDSLVEVSWRVCIQ